MRSAFVIANKKNVRTVPMRILNGQPIVSKYVILYHMITCKATDIMKKL